ncbi:MAG: SpoIID/LytB domain-containing protein [Lachnospiraceae bacterium]|nr:SpoIID/LytB domain-containing protein [Lachnospiraceae bacterium]
MSEKIKTILSILIILIILPYIITYALQGNMLFDIEQDETERNMENGEQTEILTGILAGQIAMDSPAEAIRAQAVLVRTEYMRRQAAGEAQEQSLSMEEMASLWGSQNLQKNYEVAKAAVTDTAGEVLTYEGTPIFTAYHKVSAGSTRAAGHLNGEETPYLTSVVCGMDITSPDYLAVRFFSKKEFAKALGLPEDEDLENLTMEKDTADYVKNVKVADKSFTGDEVRGLLELPSPCFYIKEVEGEMRIVVKGKGHGVGMSQYAACKQAENGANHEDILNYFFPGTTLEKI